VKAAVQGQRAFAAYLATQFETQHIQIFDDHQQAHQVELPTSALRLLVDILAELAGGNAVKVVPVHAALTAQRGGSAQRVPAPFYQADGVLAFHRTGKHRWVRFADLMHYKEVCERAGDG